MPTHLTCPQGHQWESLPGTEGESTDEPLLCPVCGVLVERDSSDENVSSATMDYDSQVPVVDVSLRTREYTSAEAMSAAPNDDVSAATTGATDAPPRTAAAPVWPTVAGYEILGELGRGGMGVVYKARQIKLNRLAALKMILAGAHAGVLQLERFRTEAEAVARLQHPNVVQIYEIGEQDGLPFFSLEFVDGGSLADKLAVTALPARQAAEVTAALAQAMHAAHQRGIIHRDLKPANVLLDRAGTPKITDFGLAKKLDEAGGHTHTGAIMGTPSYMAPEQAEGRTQEIGPAADIYALGAILYETLTGRPPFKSATLVDTLVQVRTQEPVTPRQLLPNLPRDLNTICLKCLEKEPCRRYATAGELADELKRWLAGEPIQARPTPVWERIGKWIKRRPAIAVLLAAVVAVTLLGFALVTWQWQRAESERDKAAHLAEAENVAKNDAQQQKEAALEARRREERQRRAAQRTATNLLLERGVGLCRQRQYGAGLLWLARGLDAAPDDDSDLQATLRNLLGGWNTHVCGCTLVLEHPPRVLSAALSADGKTIVTGGWSDKSARLWDAATGRPLAPPMPHPGIVPSVAFSPDGKTVLTVSVDNMVRLWRADTAAPRGELPRHPSRIHAARFSPDGKYVATACRDKKARLWDRTTKQLVGTPMTHDGEVVAVSFSPDGKCLATASRDKTARLWETATGKPLGPPLKHAHEVPAVAVAADGKTVLTGCLDTARLWEGTTGQPVGEPLTGLGAIWAVAFSPDDRTFLTAGQDGTCRLWDRASRQLVAEPIHCHATITAASFAADGRTLLTAGYDGTARLWRISRLQPRYEGRWHQGIIHSVNFSPDGRSIVTASADKTARLWDAATGKPRCEPLLHDAAVFDALFSPDGASVLTRSGSVVQLWDAATGMRRGQPLRHQAVINSAVFSPDGRWILTASADHTARLWRTDTGRPAGKPIEHEAMATHAVFSRDGRLLASVGADGIAHLRRTDSQGTEDLATLRHGSAILAAAFNASGEVFLTRGGKSVRLWQVQTGQPIGSPIVHGTVVQAAAFSPDGRRVATASFDKAARLVDCTTGKSIAVLGHESSVQEALFSPDSQVLATRAGNAVRLWRADTGQPLAESLRHGDVVSAIVFHPNGHILLSAGQDATARLWDASTGQPLCEPLPHPEAITLAAFSPDGRTLLICGSTGRARSWPVPPPLVGEPGRIAQLLRVRTGLMLDPSGTVTALDAATWRREWQTIQPQGKPAAR
jgi:WD40 repeat protein/serine/threonine protein kinase